MIGKGLLSEESVLVKGMMVQAYAQYMGRWHLKLRAVSIVVAPSQRFNCVNKLVEWETNQRLG